MIKMNYSDSVKDITETRGFSAPVPDRLLAGTEIAGRYRVGLDYTQRGVLAVYTGTDMNLHRRVDVLEFLPLNIAGRDNDGITVCETGTGGSYGDAKSVFRKNVDKLKSIDSLGYFDGFADYFEENNTIYLIRPKSNLTSLSDYMGKKSHSRFSAQEINCIMCPVVKQLRLLHENGMCHGNISPDSIFTDGKTSELRFISLLTYPKDGFSDCRFSDMVKDYMAPETFYGKESASTCSDLYSVSAITYRLLTGYVPRSAGERVSIRVSTGKDPLVPIQRYRPFAPRSLADAVISGLGLESEGRTAILEVFGSDC